MFLFLASISKYRLLLLLLLNYCLIRYYYRNIESIIEEELKLNFTKQNFVFCFSSWSWKKSFWYIELTEKSIHFTSSYSFYSISVKCFFNSLQRSLNNNSDITLPSISRFFGARSTQKKSFCSGIDGNNIKKSYQNRFYIWEIIRLNLCEHFFCLHHRLLSMISFYINWK